MSMPESERDVYADLAVSAPTPPPSRCIGPIGHWPAACTPTWHITTYRPQIGAPSESALAM